MDIKAFHENLYTSSGLSISLHGVVSLTDAKSYDKLIYQMFVLPLKLGLHRC